MNRVELKGGLTRDAEVRVVGQSMLCEFTIAVNGARWSSQQSQQIVKTIYVTCQAWGLVAEEIADRGGLQKGNEVWVVGELDQYRKDGEDQKPSTRVVVFDYRVLRGQHPSVARAGTPAAARDPWA